LIHQEKLLHVSQVLGASKAVLDSLDIMNVVASLRHDEQDSWYAQLPKDESKAAVEFAHRISKTDQAIQTLLNQPNVLLGYEIGLATQLENLENVMDYYLQDHYFPGFKPQLKIAKIRVNVTEFRSAVKKITWKTFESLYKKYAVIHLSLEELMKEYGFKTWEELTKFELITCSNTKKECPYSKTCTKQCGKTVDQIGYKVEAQKLDYEDIEIEKCPFCGEGTGKGVAVILEPLPTFNFSVGYIVCKKCGKIYGEY
jgi:hypothetical protein